MCKLDQIMFKIVILSLMFVITDCVLIKDKKMPYLVLAVIILTLCHLDHCQTCMFKKLGTFVFILYLSSV